MNYIVKRWGGGRGIISLIQGVSRDCKEQRKTTERNKSLWQDEEKEFNERTAGVETAEEDAV